MLYLETQEVSSSDEFSDEKRQQGRLASFRLRSHEKRIAARQNASSNEGVIWPDRLKELAEGERIRKAHSLIRKDDCTDRNPFSEDTPSLPNWYSHPRHQFLRAP